MGTRRHLAGAASVTAARFEATYATPRLGTLTMDADTPEADRVQVWFLNASEVAATRAKLATLQQRAVRKGFTGRIDLAAEPELALHDMAAVSIVVQEAGGRFTGLDGVDGPGQGSGVSTNGLLHDEVLSLLASSS